MFALEWALLALWRSWGIEPALMVMGMGVGDIVAACAAGVFTLPDATPAASGRCSLDAAEGSRHHPPLKRYRQAVSQVEKHRGSKIGAARAAPRAQSPIH